jgi:putative membrane protein
MVMDGCGWQDSQPTLNQTQDKEVVMMFWGCGANWGMGLGWIFMILLWGLAVLGIVALVRLLAGGGFRRSTALEILQKRYARGEIGQDEYEQKRRELQE